MKKTLMLIFAAGVLASCGDTSALEDELTNAMDEAIEEAKSVEEDSSDDSATSENDGTVYSVLEFHEMFSDDAASLKGKTVTIEGYYLNYNSQDNQDGSKQYMLSLFADDSFDFQGKKVFFIMATDDSSELNKLTQRSKVKITGKVTGEKFFEDPELEDAKLVK